mgnify:CR=1 FL=1
MIGLFFSRLKIFPKWIYWTVRDFILWIKNKGWKNFEGWGLHLYVARFGEGKTCSIVRDAYNLCSDFPQLSLLTNIKVQNFPEHTKILPLNSPWDIINAPANTLVLIDEIGTIFNSRDWSSSKGGGVPKILFQHIVQCRKRNIQILATTQHYRYLDIQLRRVTATVTVCSAFLKHPFTRMITNRVYNAEDYELFIDNPMFPLVCMSASSYIQTDFLRSLYDTDEIVQTLMQLDYNSDEEILRSSGGASASSNLPPSLDKKKQREILDKIRKGGL